MREEQKKEQDGDIDPQDFEEIEQSELEFLVKSPNVLAVKSNSLAMQKEERLRDNKPSSAFQVEELQHLGAKIERAEKRTFINLPAGAHAPRGHNQKEFLKVSINKDATNGPGFTQPISHP